MTDTIDTIAKRLEKLSAHVQRPPEQEPHAFNMDLFNQEEQEALNAFLVEVIAIGSLKELSDGQLDTFAGWFELEQTREFTQQKEVDII